MNTATFFTIVQDDVALVEETMRAQTGAEPHPDLRVALEHLLSAGGKRIRPTVVFLIGRMLGAPKEKLVTLGALVEMLHTATVVHDDLIDGSFSGVGCPL